MEAAATVENRNDAVSHRGLENAPRFPQLPPPSASQFYTATDADVYTLTRSRDGDPGGGMLLKSRGPMVLKTDNAAPQPILHPPSGLVSFNPLFYATLIREV